LGGRSDDLDLLPKMLRELLNRSDNLYRRIARLDDVLFGGDDQQKPGVQDHMNRLEQAFGNKN
jgi:regulator of CtrA degradation